MKDKEDIVVGVVGIIFLFIAFFYYDYNKHVLFFTLGPIGFIMAVYGFRRYMGGRTPEDNERDKLLKKKEALELEKLKREVEELEKEVKA